MYLWRKRRLILLLAVSLSLLYFAVYERPTGSRHQPRRVISLLDDAQSRKKEGRRDSCYSDGTKLILFYTTLFGKKPWMDIGSKESFLADCPFKKCEISYDENDITRSDLVIFHAGDMSGLETLESIHQDRRPDQRMAYLSHENILFTPDVSQMPDGFFNWTITYKRTSDFPIPYGHYIPLDYSGAAAVKAGGPVNYAEGKDKLVAWAVSHCGTVREKYVQELVKYIKVDVYGNCASVYGQNNECPRSSPRCDELFKTYKFYLAFENSVCTDYITEKFWRSLRWKVVPIVLSTDYYTPVAPPGSFISVQEFPTVKALAEHLLYLDKNDTAFNEYFRWRQKFTARQRHWFQFTACDICDALHDRCRQAGRYDRLQSFWNAPTDCQEREILLLKLIEGKD